LLFLIRINYLIFNIILNSQVIWNELIEGNLRRKEENKIIDAKNLETKYLYIKVELKTNQIRTLKE
jgi:hypothetical protein